MSTWSNLVVTLGHLGLILRSLWPKLAEVGAKLGLSWPNLAPSSDPVEPKSGNVEKVLVFKAFLEGQGSREESGAGCNGASRTAGRV